jgi:hypothetical protein
VSGPSDQPDPPDYLTDPVRAHDERDRWESQFTRELRQWAAYASTGSQTLTAASFPFWDRAMHKLVAEFHQLPPSFLPRLLHERPDPNADETFDEIARRIAPTLPTALTGMKLGTGTTAPAKAGVGAASLAASADYISGSGQVFDTSFPSTTNLGTTLGVQAVYKVTYAAGTATNSAIASAVIVNDAATNLTTTVANTVSRVTFTAVNKGASDTLAITWNHLFLGA